MIVSISIEAWVGYFHSMDPYVFFLVCFFFWMASHFFCLKIFEFGLSLFSRNHRVYMSKVNILPHYRLSNLRRLMRSFLFCLISCSMGGYLLFNYYHHYPHDLLLAWSENHYCAFVIAASHWIFCLVEDYWAGDATHSFTKLDIIGANIYRRDLIRHHLVTFFAYMWCLNTHYLSALCVFGLCFELPVFFITYREIIFGYDDVFGLLETLSFGHFKLIWFCIYAGWHATRTVFCLHWPWSLVFWRKYLSTIPGWSFWVYHFLGISFNYANWRILFTVLATYAVEDARRFGVYIKKSKSASGDETYLVDKRQETSDVEGNESSGSATMACPRYMSNEEMNKLNSSNGSASGGCPFKGQGTGLKLIGPKELAQHDSKDDCWMLIRGKVYNLTEFLTQHPGGQAILLKYAGKDGTEGFNDAQHSSKAHGMMAKYLCAEMLPHGYDQTGVDEKSIYEANNKQSLTAEEKKEMKRKQAELDSQLDDTNLPFHFMNRYFTWFDPVVPSIVLPLVCVYVFINYVPEITAAASSNALSVDAALSSSLSFVVKQLGYASLLVLLLSNPTMQQTIIPNYGHFWVPGSWIGSPSFVMKSVLNYLLSALTNPRVHIGALANLLHWTTLCCILMFVYDNSNNSCLAFLRVSLVMASLCEFGGGYFATAFSDPSRPSYFHYFRPLIIFKNFLDGFESLKYFGIVCLYISVALDMYDILISKSTDQFNITASTTDRLQLMGLPLPALSPTSFLVWCIVVCGFSRMMYSKCLHAIGEPLNGDSFGAVSLTLPMSALYGYIVLLTINPVDSAVANQVVVSDAVFWWRTTVLVLLVTLMQTSYSVFVHMTRSSFALHTQQLLCALLLWYYSPNIGGGWWSFFWYMFGIHCLGRDSSRVFQHMGFNGKDAPAYWYRLKEVEEKFRYYVLSVIYWLIFIPFVNFLTFLAPFNNRFWAPPGMVVDIPDGEYGIAMMLNAKDQREPTLFQCNVGYMTTTGPDLVGTVQETQEMLRELAADPEAGRKGFVSDMVVVFQLPSHAPARQQGYEFRELNFSAWADEKSSYDWYKNSTAHKRIVQQYYNAGLHSFSALLARLKPPPEAPLRWEVRCTTCRKMVLGPKVTECPYCNSKMNSLPYL